MAAVGLEAVAICADSSRVGLSTSTRQVRFSSRCLAVGEMMEDRQREGGGLAGAGLRDADDVAPASTCGMVWAWIGVGSVYLFVNESAGDGLGKAELKKGVVKMNESFV